MYSLLVFSPGAGRPQAYKRAALQLAGGKAPSCLYIFGRLRLRSRAPHGQSHTGEPAQQAVTVGRSVCRSVTVTVCLSVCLPVSVYLSVSASVYLSVCLSVWLTVCPSGTVRALLLRVCPNPTRRQTTQNEFRCLGPCCGGLRQHVTFMYLTNYPQSCRFPTRPKVTVRLATAHHDILLANGLFIAGTWSLFTILFITYVM
jgi:hypothetical protein